MRAQHRCCSRHNYAHRPRRSAALGRVPSKLNKDCCVPTIPPTVNAWLILNPRPPGDRHETLVSLVQEVVPHTTPDTLAVAVEWSAPKLCPEIDNEAPPLVGAFIGACADGTGAAAATVAHSAQANRRHSVAYRHS